MNTTAAVRASIFLLFAITAAPTFGQWTRSGTQTILENLGDNVGIDTAAPKVKLDVGGWDGKPSNIANVKTSVQGDLVFGNVGPAAGNVFVPRARLLSSAVQAAFTWNIFYTDGQQLQLFNPAQPAYEINLNGTNPGLGEQWVERDKIVFRRFPPGWVNGSTTLFPAALLTIDGTNSFGKVGINNLLPTQALDISGNAKIDSGADNGANALHVRGNITATGTLTALDVIGSSYEDIAEWVPATLDMPAGTVVVLNPDRANEVMPSHRAYDTSVAGVVSERPGIVLGRSGEAKEKIATYGRVKVRVDATALPIRIGDLLVTSDKPGTAMRSQPLDLKGRSFHQPGTIVGKALEPLPSGEGEILVLLSLQ